VAEGVGGRVVGRVGQVWLYPVKSLAGTPVTTARVEAGGLAGDRAWTVVDVAGRPVRAKDVPALADLSPDVDADVLSTALGRPVRLDPLPPAPGVAPVHLVSRQATERAAAGEVPEGCSADDPRANLVLDLDGDDERSWVGRTVRIGGALLEITRTPKHCLGVYAEVRSAGTVTVGDAVLI
jgi:uncharacterized protein YcbX